MATLQPVPRFCILRPEGRYTPLIALDQLPSWLWVKGADQAHPFLNPDMILAYRGMVPRDGEYDVVCRNCYSTVDNLHRSSSQSYDPSPPPVAPSRKHTRNLSDARGPCRTEYPVMPRYHLPFVDLHGLNAYVEDPYVGMCLIECPWPLNTVRLSSVLPSMAPKGPISPSSDCSIGSKLNPEALAFDPTHIPAPYALPSPTRAQPVDDPIFHVSDPDCFSDKYTGGNEQPPSTPAQKFHAALEQLKSTIGIGRDLESPVLEPEPTFPMTRYLVGKEGGRRPRKDDRRCRGGHARKARAKRLGATQATFAPRQYNAATKRQARREKMMARQRQGKGDHQRYRHMRMSAWRRHMARR